MRMTRHSFLMAFGLVGALATQLSCSKSDSTAAAPSATAGGAAFSAVNSTLSKIATPPGGVVANGLVVNSAENSSDDIHVFSNATDWTTGLLSDPRNSGGTCSLTSPVSPKTFMGVELTESAVRCNGSDVNVFGRVHSALSLACIMGHLLPFASSDLLPTSGTKTYAIDSATSDLIATDCKQKVPAGITSVSLTFAVPTDTTNFDRLISLDAGSGFTSTIYIRYTATQVAVARNESNSNGANRAVVLLNRTTNVLRAEYLSGPTATSQANFDGVYLHRIYYDATNDIGRVVTSIETDATLSQGAAAAVDSIYTKFVLTAKPDHQSTQDFAMSLDFYGPGWGTYTTSGASYNMSACVTPSTGVLSNSAPVVTANQFTCGGVTGIAPGGFTADAAAWTYVHTHLSNWFNFTAVPDISWDMTTIHTASEVL
jgi:hypothetical protein